MLQPTSRGDITDVTTDNSAPSQGRCSQLAGYADQAQRRIRRNITAYHAETDIDYIKSVAVAQCRQVRENAKRRIPAEVRAWPTSSPLLFYSMNKLGIADEPFIRNSSLSPKFPLGLP